MVEETYPFVDLKAFAEIPYTRVNKRIHLFSKLKGNMRLIAKGKFNCTSKTVMLS